MCFQMDVADWRAHRHSGARLLSVKLEIISVGDPLLRFSQPLSMTHAALPVIITIKKVFPQDLPSSLQWIFQQTLPLDGRGLIEDCDKPQKLEECDTSRGDLTFKVVLRFMKKKNPSQVKNASQMNTDGNKMLLLTPTLYPEGLSLLWKTVISVTPRRFWVNVLDKQSATQNKNSCLTFRLADGERGRQVKRVILMASPTHIACCFLSCKGYLVKLEAHGCLSVMLTCTSQNGDAKQI